MESTLAGQTAPKEIMDEIKTRDPSGAPDTIIARIQGRPDWVNGNDSV
ncbi:MAG: hypothetical protein P8L78_14150 [Mariniblastus sp.]|nr:hypothetical protein [Mariniblastus sp.]MDG2182827.1 hypothetical protein [Mariniblastus sp.]